MKTLYDNSAAQCSLSSRPAHRITSIFRRFNKRCIQLEKQAREQAILLHEEVKQTTIMTHEDIVKVVKEEYDEAKKNFTKSVEPTTELTTVEAVKNSVDI